MACNVESKSCACEPNQSIHYHQTVLLDPATKSAAHSHAVAEWNRSYARQGDAAEEAAEKDAAEEETVTQAESDAIFDIFDKDGDGSVRMDELIEMVAASTKTQPGSAVRAAPTR